MSTEVKQQLDWRRSKVLELSSQGREISEILKVSDPSVHGDLVFVRQQASISSGSDTTNPFLPS